VELELDIRRVLQDFMAGQHSVASGSEGRPKAAPAVVKED
jgi:hypothetical protein